MQDVLTEHRTLFTKHTWGVLTLCIRILTFVIYNMWAKYYSTFMAPVHKHLCAGSTVGGFDFLDS